MIPLRDIIPSRTTPFVTVGLIAVNVLVFLYQATLPPRASLSFLYTWSMVPAGFAWPTLVTSMFLHGGWLHLLGNMLYLWIFGDNVEDRVGHGRFVFFYLGCGIAAGLAHLISNPMSIVPTVGASGAIAGVMGAYFVLYPRSRILTLIPLIIYFEVIEVPAILFLGFWFVLQLLSGVGTLGRADAASGGIAFWAHIAGFVAGASLIFVARRPERVRPEWWSK
jgi:membrane associated rhomboid family serine protease